MSKINIAITVLIIAGWSTASAQENQDRNNAREQKNSFSREEMKNKWQDHQRNQDGDERRMHPGSKPGGPGGPRGMVDKFITNPRVAEKLGLTEDQIAQLKTTSEQSQARQEELMKAMQEAGKKQAEYMTADSVNEADVMTAIEETGKIRTEMAKLKTMELMNLQKILTQEQREKLREFMKQHHEGNRENDMSNEERGRGHDGDGGMEKKRPEMDERRREEMKQKMMERREEWEKRRKTEEQQERKRREKEEEGLKPAGDMFQM